MPQNSVLKISQLFSRLNPVLLLERWVRWTYLKLPLKRFKKPNLFVHWGRLVDDQAERRLFIDEARANSRFIKLEQYLFDEGFAEDEKPVVLASRRYDLRTWPEKGQKPFSFQTLLKYLNRFESKQSINRMVIKYSALAKLQTATAHYVVIPTPSGSKLVCIVANIFQEGKYICCLSVDPNHNVHAKRF